MTHAQLTQAAIDYLGKVFTGTTEKTDSHLVQAAVALVLTPEPLPAKP